MAPSTVARRATSSPQLLSLTSTLLATLAAALCFIDGGPLRWVGGFALVLLIPGDAIRRALRVAADGVSDAIFAVAVSLAASVLLGLALDQLSPGISARTMAVGLLAVSLIANVAASRPLPRDAPGRNATQQQTGEAHDSPGLTWKHYAAAAALFAVPAAFGVGFAVRASNRHDASQATTSLSIVQQGRNAVIEVVEQSPGEHSYTVVAADKGTLLLRRSLKLRSGQTTSILLDISSLGAGQQISAALVEPGSHTAYRLVTLRSNSA